MLRVHFEQTNFNGQVQVGESTLKKVSSPQRDAATLSVKLIEPCAMLLRAAAKAVGLMRRALLPSFVARTNKHSRTNRKTTMITTTTRSLRLEN
jgi:hypothetical protein